MRRSTDLPAVLRQQLEAAVSLTGLGFEAVPGGPHIEVDVVNADALEYEVDVLVLKHAQESLGVDAVVKQKLGLDLEMTLRPGADRIVDGWPELGARKVLFLGVPPLEKFGYREIRLFARRAIALVGTEIPDAREVCLTLHGVGFGMDEIACFEEEVAGLREAFAQGTAPAGLERVVIVELDSRRVDRLRRHLEEGQEDVAETSSAGKAHAFAAIPFSPQMEDVFTLAISPCVRESGLLCERIDQEAFTGDILSRIKDKIRTASLVVADLTDANPNVYLEVGFAWACEVPTVLVHQCDVEPMFDVRGEKCLPYVNVTELKKLLTAELPQLVPQR